MTTSSFLGLLFVVAGLFLLLFHRWQSRLAMQWNRLLGWTTDERVMDVSVLVGGVVFPVVGGWFIVSPLLAGSARVWAPGVLLSAVGAGVAVLHRALAACAYRLSQRLGIESSQADVLRMGYLLGGLLTLVFGTVLLLNALLGR